LRFDVVLSSVFDSFRFLLVLLLLASMFALLANIVQFNKPEKKKSFFLQKDFANETNKKTRKSSSTQAIN
jgi:cellobiose-specific phosphotransferase system component IIC